MKTQLKTCSRCGVSKPASPEYFHRDKSRRDGLFHACHECEHARQSPKTNKPVAAAGHKICGCCGQEKPATLEFFAVHKNGANGVRSICRLCRAAQAAEWYAANRDKSAEYGKRYRLVNRERRKQHAAIYYQENKDRRNEYSRKWAAEHPERILEIGRSSAKRHPEKRKHKLQRRRALKRNADGTHTRADVQAQYDRQHGECYYCHKRVGDTYHADHVVPLSRGGSDWPDNIVIACPTCNQRKREKLPHEWAEGGRLL